ncbi:MAG: hypothetical protein AAGD00_03990 [Planctomycetota bacterium]
MDDTALLGVRPPAMGPALLREPISGESVVRVPASSVPVVPGVVSATDITRSAKRNLLLPGRISLSIVLEHARRDMS